MIWFFERQHARLHYEIRRESDGPGYEIAITHPDGRQVTEQYRSPGDLTARAKALQDALIADGWQAPPLMSRASLSRRAQGDRRGPYSPHIKSTRTEHESEAAR